MGQGPLECWDVALNWILRKALLNQSQEGKVFIVLAYNGATDALNPVATPDL